MGFLHPWTQSTNSFYLLAANYQSQVIGTKYWGEPLLSEASASFHVNMLPVKLRSCIPRFTPICHFGCIISGVLTPSCWVYRPCLTQCSTGSSPGNWKGIWTSFTILWHFYLSWKGGGLLQRQLTIPRVSLCWLAWLNLKTAIWLNHEDGYRLVKWTHALLIKLSAYLLINWRIMG